jgi:hypothetical protein
MLTHSFYGAKYLSTMRLQPNGKRVKTLGEIFKVLLACWSRDTADEKHLDTFSRANPSVAQDDVTAMLIYDMFGGSIHSVEVDGRVHYFNKINGNYIDMTREQFEYSRTPVCYEPNTELERKEFEDNADQKRRYLLLLSRISEYLKG